MNIFQFIYLLMRYNILHVFLLINTIYTEVYLLYYATLSFFAVYFIIHFILHRVFFIRECMYEYVFILCNVIYKTSGKNHSELYLVAVSYYTEAVTLQY